MIFFAGVFGWGLLTAIPLFLMNLALLTLAWIKRKTKPGQQKVYRINKKRIITATIIVIIFLLLVIATTIRLLR